MKVVKFIIDMLGFLVKVLPLILQLLKISKKQVSKEDEGAIVPPSSDAVPADSVVFEDIPDDTIHNNRVE